MPRPARWALVWLVGYPCLGLAGNALREQACRADFAARGRHIGRLVVPPDVVVPGLRRVVYEDELPKMTTLVCAEGLLAPGHFYGRRLCEFTSRELPAKLRASSPLGGRHCAKSCTCRSGPGRFGGPCRGWTRSPASGKDNSHTNTSEDCMDNAFSHLDSRGNVCMVDVGHKPATRRVAVAEALVRLAPATLDLLRRAALPKGDVLTCAKIGGIMAAKRTAELIPMCHSLGLSYADVRFEIDEAAATIRILSEARTDGPTGVEMEAIVAAQMAAATIYDMCKAVQRDIVIERVRLLLKDGGKSGRFEAPDARLPEDMGRQDA